MTRARLAGVTALLLAAAGHAIAALPAGATTLGTMIESREALLVVVPGMTFPQATTDPQLRRIASIGGIGMLRGQGELADVIASIDASDRASVVASLDDPSEALRLVDVTVGSPLVVIVVTSEGSGFPDSIVLARGSPVVVPAEPRGPPRTLTSDSTRRVGIVTPEDVAATVADAIDDPSIDVGDGSPIDVVDAAPPVDLYERYADYRQLTVPIQALVAGWEAILAVAALLAIRSGRGRRAALGAVLSLPGLFLALLLVGHLPRLTFATVVPVLVAVSIAGGVPLVRLADREGIGTALAWAGGIALGGLVVESLVGWTAAFAPMLGGSHLDGARFFGMPNAEIGLAVGGALLVAQRLRSGASGIALLVATALWAGAPWFGANLGAAVTAGAAAGAWWAIRRRRGALGAGLATVVGAGAGGLAAVGLNRLDPRPTHIARASEDATAGGVAADLGRRLEIGARLIAEQPAAAIPVAGTAVGLALITRPPRRLASAFDQAPGTRDAALAIGVASVVAFIANDTGAAALGLGFGLMAVVLFGVLLASLPGKMDR